MRAEIVEPIAAKYEPRILAVLEKIRKVIEDAGFNASEPDDFTDEEYQWGMAVYQRDVDCEPGSPESMPIMDVMFTIVEKDVRGDAESDTDYGLSFTLDVTAWGGRMLGGFSPFNYSDRLWVWGEDEIEQRFRLFEEIDWSEIAVSARRADELRFVELAKED